MHGKGSLLGKQVGDRWQQFAGLRLLFGYQWAQPGKKLLFMGGEFGVEAEWNHEQELSWGLLEHAEHRGVQDWVRDLNQLLTSTPALHERDNDGAGFRWVVGDDAANSVYVFLRFADDGDPILCVANFTSSVHASYRIGVPVAGQWTEVLSGDDLAYGGSGISNGDLETQPESCHGYDQSLELTIPPLAVAFFSPASRDS